MKHLWPILLLLLAGCSRPVTGPQLVVYCALDQVYAEPVLQDFERTTGIKVQAKYDLEATKTSGLVNQLILEKANPRCDVFWNNEILQTVVLARLGLLQSYASPAAAGISPQFVDPDHQWTGFAARLRVIIYNPAKLAGRPVPTSLFELGDPAWKGETAFSMPLFGTSLTHCAALRQQLGPDQMKQWLDGSLANGMQVVDGNAVVKDRVVAGLYTWGFTDTDDANSAIEDGAPVKMVIPDQDGIGTLVIPNTVSILKNCPHPEQARQLVDYLLSAEVEQRLAAGRSLQIPLHQGVELPAGVPDISQLKVMQVDYDTMAAEFTDTLNWLRQAVDR